MNRPRTVSTAGGRERAWCFRSSMIAVVLSLLAAGTAWAQTPSLADIAKREAERRSSVTATQVLTDGDIASSEPSGGPVDPSSSTPSPAESAETDAEPPAAEAETSEDETAAEKGAERFEAADKRPEEYWRKRTEDYKTRLQRLRDDIEGVQLRINQTNTRLLTTDAEAERKSLERARGEDTTVIERFRQALAFLEDEYEDYRELGRLRDVPAEWLR